jgi:hypothetical protein
MRYSVALEHGGWVVWDPISREIKTHPATSEEAQEACREMNERCEVRRLDPPVKVEGWGPLGELTHWLLAEDGCWGQVVGKDGVRWVRAEDLRPKHEPGLQKP